MKVLMKSVDMIAWFTRDGLPTPVRFRLETPDGSAMVIRIARIIDRKEEKLAGNRMIVFTCQSIIDGIEKIYEIKYELNSCRWYLFKI